MQKREEEEEEEKKKEKERKKLTCEVLLFSSQNSMAYTGFTPTCVVHSTLSRPGPQWLLRACCKTMTEFEQTRAVELW